jgi:alpha-N-arabinofuranosidase
VWLPQVNGIDPSLFIEENGKAYLLYNSIPPGNVSVYDGHRTIRMFEFDIDKLKVIGEEKILINGGVDITKKPVWIEGPHIFIKNGWYYLICAEGGTGYNHSEVVFRSRSMAEPFIPFEKNPILTQRHLDPSRKNPVTTTGHADFVETPDGKWYAVFLGCRPYEKEHYNIGRETFMAPVTWVDDWPIILKGNEEVAYSYPVPMPSVTRKELNPFSGNFSYQDDFASVTLDHRWMFLRTIKHPWYSLTSSKGKLAMDVRPETCSGTGNPSFIAHRQQHHKGSVSVSVEFNPTEQNEKAGIVAFQNETHFFYLCKSVINGKPQIQLFSSTKDSSMLLLASHHYTGGAGVILKIEMDRNDYKFSYSEKGSKWTTLQYKIDGRNLSTATAGGFVGSVFALYATSQGRPSNSKAWFDNFHYIGNDDVYKGK